MFVIISTLQGVLNGKYAGAPVNVKSARVCSSTLGSENMPTNEEFTHNSNYKCGRKGVYLFPTEGITHLQKFHCIHRRLISSYAFTQSDQSLRCPQEDVLGLLLPRCVQQTVSAQAARTRGLILGFAWCITLLGHFGHGRFGLGCFGLRQFGLGRFTV